MTDLNLCTFECSIVQLIRYLNDACKYLNISCLPLSSIFKNKKVVMPDDFYLDIPVQTFEFVFFVHCNCPDYN